MTIKDGGFIKKTPNKIHCLRNKSFNESLIILPLKYKLIQTIKLLLKYKTKMPQLKTKPYQIIKNERLINTNTHIPNKERKIKTIYN